MVWIIVLLSVGLGAGSLFYKQRTKAGVESALVCKQLGDNRESVAREPDYRAVAIKPGKEPCPSVLEIGDQPFLIGSAPLLPLKECNQPACDCYYQHREDRRDDDRRHPFASLTNTRLGVHGGEERRDTNRRANDQLD